MFGSFKKAMVVAAVAAVSAVAPAVASADQWTVTGAPFAGAADVGGTLTLTVLANGAQTTCDVAATVDLSNPGGVAAGSVTSFVLGAAAGGACTTNVPGCDVSAVANTTTPWTIGTSATSVTIGGVLFTNSYVNKPGQTCSLHGANVSASGSVTGTASGNVLTFVNAGPLTTTLPGSLPARVDGTVEVNDEVTGDPVSLS